MVREDGSFTSYSDSNHYISSSKSISSTGKSPVSTLFGRMNTPYPCRHSKYFSPWTLYTDTYQQTCGSGKVSVTLTIHRSSRLVRRTRRQPTLLKQTLSCRRIVPCHVCGNLVRLIRLGIWNLLGCQHPLLFSVILHPAFLRNVRVFGVVCMRGPCLEERV